MLVLTRTIEQEIRIGADIRVKVLSVQGGQVRLGIEAPRHIAVHRGELLEAVSQQNEAARAAAEAPAETLRRLATQVQRRVYMPEREAESRPAGPSPIVPLGQRDTSAEADRGPADRGAPSEQRQGSCCD